MTARPGYGLTDAGGTDRRVNTLDIAAAFIGNNERRKPQTANRKPQTANRKPQTANRKPQTANRKPQTANRKPQTANRKPQTANRKPHRPARSVASRAPELRPWRGFSRFSHLTTLVLMLSVFSLFAAVSVQAQTATVELSASPTQVWEGQVSRVTATLSHALPHDVWLGVTVTPCPSGSWCHRFNSYPIYIAAGRTVGHLKGPVDPDAKRLTHSGGLVGTDPIAIGGYWLYQGPQTSLLTVRDADGEHEEVTVALKSSLAKDVRAGSKTSQKITVLDPDGFAMTLTADKQPAEGGGVVKVTVDLGHPAPPGFFAKINSSASTAKFGYSVGQGYQADWTMDGEVGIEEPYVAAGPVLPRSTSSVRGPCSRYTIKSPIRCIEYISADDWNNRDWQRMHYLKDWKGASKKMITINIADDNFVDPGETIVLQGIGYIYATGIDHGGSSGFPKGQVQSNELRLTIKDNDGGAAADAPILMSALPTIARESGTGDDSTARVPVVLSRPATEIVSVNYRTASGGFTDEPEDFEGFGSGQTNPEGTLTFAAGERRKEIEITIKDDNEEDSGETINVWFRNFKPTSVVRWGGTGVGGQGYTVVTIINDEADLGGLTVQGAPGAGGPYSNLDIGTFAAATTDYTVTVPHGTTHARLVPTTPLGSYQNLKAGTGSNLTAVRSGAAGPAVALAVGDTVLVVQATASTGERKTYRVTVTRQAPPLTSNADLSALSAEAGTGGSWTALGIGAFAAGTTAYAATVPHETTHVRLTATAADADATLTLPGTVALQVGANALAVRVTAEDGTVKTYAVTVTREARALSSNADLSALSAEAGTGGSWTALGIGAFAAGTTAYAATVPHGTTQARLTATAADAGAALTLPGTVALQVGANALAVRVTAEDGTSKSYRVTITRQAAPVVPDPVQEEPAETLTEIETDEPPAEEESQTQQAGGDPPADQGESPSDDGGGDNPNGEAQGEEQETQREEEESQEQHEKDASLDLTGTNGPDNLEGGDAGDLLVGKQGDDFLVGNGGNDELRGGKGNDELHGGRGADALYGGNGNDLLYGDRGADKLLGGNGDDTYTGGPGADRFVFFSGETGDKIITDFGDGSDQIVLRTEAFAWPSVADIIAGVVAQGDRYLVYTLSPGLTVETDVPLRPEDFVAR